MIPRATYRLQFHAGFTFADGAKLAPYLARLGISHLYASPITTARAGSMHGYDVVDPTAINPEFGGEAGFRAMVAALRQEGLGVILDIVPNHMAVGGADNRYWLDVLERGEESDYAEFFDIDWRPADPALHGKVSAPFLGAPYAEALAGGDIVLDYDAKADQLAAVAHGAHRLPIRRQDYSEVLQDDPGALAHRFDPKHDESRARLHALLERQHFRLAWWRTAGDEINWRRFFDITGLAGVRVERPEVFEIVHGLVLRLYAEGLIDGVRVDHVDGLADPAAYCRTLRGRLGQLTPSRPEGLAAGPAYFVVEKILAKGEALSPHWGADGTTGYDYMNEASALMHDAAGGCALAEAWSSLSGRPSDFAVEERSAREEIVAWSFAGQLDAATLAFHRLARSHLSTRDLSAGAIKRALFALLRVFPVYRTYGVGDHVPTSDRPILARAVAAAKAQAAPGEGEIPARIAAWLRGEGPGETTLKAEAARRFQQLSAPVSAKAVEDTAFYRYSRLLSRNDVGFDPARLACSIQDAHAANAARAERFPHAMLTTATHDHKRGEDVRARLAVLSEMAQAWIEQARRWSAINGRLGFAVDPGDEYALYQTLAGVWPLDLAVDNKAGLSELEQRVAGWLEKALREAKLRSSWTAPNAVYEKTCREFLAAVLRPETSGAFLQDLSSFAQRIGPAGVMNGLVQAALRCTLPGVPDLYQGCEFWDFSLVDPDNRRSVDFDARRSALEGSPDRAALAATWRDGRVKQAVIAEALALRRDLPAVFGKGAYVPLDVAGEKASHVMGFLRQAETDAVLVAVPLRCAEALLGQDRINPPASWWGDTTVKTADLSAWRRADGAPLGDGVRVAELFQTVPAALIPLRR
jgi:(1->4)-alpha-D-glucan 1-alpha-D-glucosylmutase